MRDSLNNGILVWNSDAFCRNMRNVLNRLFMMCVYVHVILTPAVIRGTINTADLSDQRERKMIWESRITLGHERFVMKRSSLPSCTHKPVPHPKNRFPFPSTPDSYQRLRIDPLRYSSLTFIAYKHCLNWLDHTDRHLILSTSDLQYSSTAQLGCKTYTMRAAVAELPSAAPSARPSPLRAMRMFS